MKRSIYVDEYVVVHDDSTYEVKKDTYKIITRNKLNTRLGVMMVGWGGNNGSTLTAGILAKKNDIYWNNKNGEQKVNFFGSISQFGSVHIGYTKKGEPHSRLFKDIGNMYEPEELIIGGWDIRSDNLYEAAKKAGVLDYDLLKHLENDLSNMKPLPSIYDKNFIATNQCVTANNIIETKSKLEQVNLIIEDIEKFKIDNELNKVIVLWTASTERFNNGKWKNSADLSIALENNDPEISPSIIFAIASAQSGCIFLNGSPQNTLVPAVIDHSRLCGTFVGGEDFKTGQTKLKSVLADWLASSGIRPLSIVSYNHLGNNDGKNLDEYPQFRSKEITKKNVIDDIVEENPILFPNGKKPDHAVVIKYIPAVGDSKRAMDEYYSELFLGGRHTLAIHNTCEDSLLAVPLMLDLIVFSEFFSRIYIQNDEENPQRFNTVLSLLSIFFKAPVVNEDEPIINAFFKQRYGLENFFRILLELPTLDHVNIRTKILS